MIDLKIDITKELDLDVLLKKLELNDLFSFEYDEIKKLRKLITDKINVDDILLELRKEFKTITISDSYYKFFDDDDIRNKIKSKKSIFSNNTVFNKVLVKSEIYNSENWFGIGYQYDGVIIFSKTGFIVGTIDKEILEEKKWELKSFITDTEKRKYFEIGFGYISCDFLKSTRGFKMRREIEKIFINLLKKDILISVEKSLKEFSIYIKKKKVEFENSKVELLSKLDKDNNGIIDVIEDNNEFSLLMKKHQKVIIEKGKEFNQNYTHQFIKVGNYIKKKRNNLQLIFDSIKMIEDQNELEDYLKILENEIHTYNLLLFNSLNLLVSLIEDDQITFYDIYEKFDKFNIFNSNWENEHSDKLTTLNKEVSELNSNIKGLMNEISEIGYMIWSSLEDLSYITENSTNMLNNRLGEINSSLNTNNLLTMIQTYQTYQINKNTKSLRG